MSVGFGLPVCQKGNPGGRNSWRACSRVLRLELDAMKIRPNLGKTARIIYISIGVVLIAGSFALALEGWERLILPVVGGGSIATGACGW